jgi:D-alanyl-D-alanine endopeptidase (penicillin-binding protein 7)
MNWRGLVYLCCFLIAQAGQSAPDQPKQADPARLKLAAVSSLVIDLEDGKLLYESYADAVLPIASITKLITAMVVLESGLPLDERLRVDISDNPALKGVFSRVRVQSELSRRELLHIALMSSENRAATTLGHHYPGGLPAFVNAMNERARTLGMQRTHFVEPTGLSPDNVSTARDLGVLLQAAKSDARLQEFSTTPKSDVFFTRPRYALSFYNTNPLLRNSGWDIQLSKTGFLDESGHCLLLVATIENRQVGIVLLDAFGKRTHFGDAGRVRRWLTTGDGGSVPPEALKYRAKKLNRLNKLADANDSSDYMVSSSNFLAENRTASPKFLH